MSIRELKLDDLLPFMVSIFETLCDILGVPYVSKIVDVLETFWSAYEAGSINIDDIESTLLQGGGKTHTPYLLDYIKVEPGGGGYDNRLAFISQAYTYATTGGAKAAIASKLKHVIVEESISGPSGDLTISGLCPVSLIVTDPEGRINSEILEVSYDRTDLNFDGELDEQIVIPDALQGQYTIQVVPEPDADPSTEIGGGQIKIHKG